MRDSGRQLRLWGLDGRIFFMLLLSLYHPRKWTFILLVVVAALFWFLENQGYTLPNAWRRLKVFLNGPHRPVVSSRRRGRSDR